MNYNDNSIISEDSAQNVRQLHNNSNTEKAQDIGNIYNKMLEQKQYMIEHNSDHSLDDIIAITDSHISRLRTLIKTNNYLIEKDYQSTPRNSQQYNIFVNQISTNTPLPHYRPYINTPVSMYPHNTTPNSTDNQPNINIDIPNNNNPQNNSSMRPNTNNNVPNINNALVQPNNPPRKRTRSSPLQSRILSNIAKSIFGKIKPLNSIKPDEKHNRFHNTFVMSTPCNYHKKIISNECDILRLILLYITLHQHCINTCSLSAIAEERIQILSTLI